MLAFVIAVKAYGSAFGAFAAFPKAALRFTRGKPKYYKSSDIAERGFCADCGTPVTMRYLDDPLPGVLIGTLDHPEEWPPTLGHSGVEAAIVKGRAQRWQDPRSSIEVDTNTNL